MLFRSSTDYNFIIFLLDFERFRIESWFPFFLTRTVYHTCLYPIHLNTNKMLCKKVRWSSPIKPTAVDPSSHISHVKLTLTSILIYSAQDEDKFSQHRLQGSFNCHWIASEFIADSTRPRCDTDLGGRLRNSRTLTARLSSTEGWKDLFLLG